MTIIIMMTIIIAAMTTMIITIATTIKKSTLTIKKQNKIRHCMYVGYLPVLENSMGTVVGLSLKKVTLEGMLTPDKVRVHRQPEGVWKEYRSRE